MNRKKVLFLIESLSCGGAEKVLATLLRHIDETRFDVTLCCVSNGGKYLGEIPRTIHYCHFLPKKESIWYKLKYLAIYKLMPPLLVYQLFVPKGNDIEIAFVEGIATKILSASTNKHAVKIAWIHTDLKNNPWTQKERIFHSVREETACYRSFNQIVCVSDTAAEAFKCIHGTPAAVSVLYNPVDTEAILAMAAAESSVGWESSGDTIRLVSAGRLVLQKGYDRLLRICGKLKREGYDFDLVILGEGEARGELEKIVSQQCLGDCVRMPGFLSNPYPIVASANLFVCPSRSEGYSTAVTEALILGVPVLVTDCSGMRELIGESGSGIITENDEGAMYTSRKALMDNRQLLTEMKEKAGSRGRDFSLKSSMEAIEGLF